MEYLSKKNYLPAFRKAPPLRSRKRAKKSRPTCAGRPAFHRTQDRTRTCTALRPLVPETSVSTNSTTWAFFLRTRRKNLATPQCCKALSSPCCPTRIRTWTDRTKICCATITQWDNRHCSPTTALRYRRCKCRGIFHFCKRKWGKFRIKVLFSCCFCEQYIAFN